MNTRDLSEGWRKGREAWREVEVTEVEFRAYVEERASSLAHERLNYVDLYLACACARGDRAALEAFEHAFFSEVETAVAKVGGAVPCAPEVQQVLRHRLFVTEPGKKPRITEFSGRGELRIWFRITATRTALNLATRAAKEPATAAADLTFLLGGGEDPELSYLRRQYTDEFKLAFEEAFRGLESRDRNLLRYAFHDAMTVDAIGAVYGVHRATAARWVVQAHANLGGRIRKALTSRLGINHKDYSSILRLIQSRLDITLDRFLSE